MDNFYCTNSISNQNEKNISVRSDKVLRSQSSRRKLKEVVKSYSESENASENVYKHTTGSVRLWYIIILTFVLCSSIILILFAVSFAIGHGPWMLMYKVSISPFTRCLLYLLLYL